MTSLLVALVILSWGAAGIFDKKALEHGSQRSVFFFFGLFNIPMALILLAVLTIFFPSWHLSRGTAFWESVDSLASLAAILAYFHAMSKAEASYVLSITAGYPLVGQLLSVPILGEPFSAPLLFAAILVSAGVAAVGFSAAPGKSDVSSGLKLDVFACIILSTVLWGLLGIFEKLSLQHGQPLESMLALSVGRGILISALAAFLWFRKQPPNLTNTRAWQFSWCSGALVAIGNISYIAALATASAGYMIVITACYPLIMYLFALFVLKERLNLLRVAGIFLIVGGAALTSLA